MIEISEIRKSICDGKVRVTADITIEDRQYPLWYEVDAQYGDVLCSTRSDAFVAGLLLYAIRAKQNLSFKTPLTWELKKSIEEDFILAVCSYNNDVYPIKLFGPTAPAIVKDKITRGTGVSCGVDSLYTIIRQMIKGGATDVKDYICIFNHHGTVGEPGKESYEDKLLRFNMTVDRAKEFSNVSGLPLIIGDTNYNSGEIPGLVSEGNATFVNMFCALCMQNQLTHYLIASAGDCGEFGYYLRQGFNKTIHENYDLLTTAAFSTRSMKISVDGLVSRDKKVKYLSNELLAQEFLDVCHVHQPGLKRNGTNDCPKCMRTVIELMALGEGVLDRFNKVFDIHYVRSHRYVYLAEMIRGLLRGSLYAKQCWGERSKMGFSQKDYVKAFFVIIRKIISKIARRGSISYQFSPDGK